MIMMIIIMINNNTNNNNKLGRSVRTRSGAEAIAVHMRLREEPPVERGLVGTKGNNYT